MALRDRYITFDGTNLKTEYGLIYSSFEEELPEPKVIKVDIPAGLDLDISDSLGVLGYHDGKQTFKFLLYADTEAERLEKKRAIINKLHGKRADYRLSWEQGYKYTGRAKVSVEHLFGNADLITIEIERSPWKLHDRQAVELNSAQYDSFTLSGSHRYHDVRITMQQGGWTKVGNEAVVQRDAAGTYVLATDVYGDTVIGVSVADWLMKPNGTDLVVNTSHISYSGTDAVIDDAYQIEGENIIFELETLQHSTLYYTRYDL